jgi:uncharacterized protein YjbI with pentapeptide repeats
MANAEQLAILRKGLDAWERWRQDAPNTWVDLSQVDLREAQLSRSNFSVADLSKARLFKANLWGTNLQKSDLRRADLRWADLTEANLSSANLREANLTGAKLTRANLGLANLSGAILQDTILKDANLSKANFEGTYLRKANLQSANLGEAYLRGADLVMADLTEADLRKAILYGANLSGADLSRANLSEAHLVGASLMRTEVHEAKVSGSWIYGINIWDLKGEFEEQKDLIITNEGDPVVTVDNIKVAQFIYLILNNEEIRDVLNVLTSKSVLILGRFTPERKVILDALRNKLREYDLLPIVFDFDRPTNRDFTETIQTLAGLSYFVIADITNPKSSPLELQATIPNYQVPFVPIIQEGEQPFAMMVDLQKKYHWVLNTVTYNSITTLIKALKPAIIEPAIQKHNELSLIKAREPKIRSASDFIDDKGLDNPSSSVE